MKKRFFLNCLFERPANFAVGAWLFFLGLIFTIMGFTVLPVFGLIIALPVLALSLAFFAARQSKECTVDFKHS